MVFSPWRPAIGEIWMLETWNMKSSSLCRDQKYFDRPQWPEQADLLA